ncbi:MAG TPA: monovalent cation/H(+) antiporter subunit G [Nocardioidaceae bacterium]|nr:monovalent cation/H(+) antiporter subunit G [Nocardioidaceae bacterium]
MSATTVVADTLLGAGVLAEIVCCAGVLWMRDVFDRLHFAAAGTTVGPVLLAAAVLVTGTSATSATVELIAALFLLLLLNPVLTHATGRAFRRLSSGRQP